MKIFLDANILVSILNKEYPVYPYAARLMSLPDKRFTICTSAVCLAIAFYFAEKKHGAVEAKKKIILLANHLLIPDCGKKEAVQAAGNPAINDYEDGLEYYTAKNAGCKFIITEDLDDFYFSDLEVMNSEGFLRKMIKQ